MRWFQVNLFAASMALVLLLAACGSSPLAQSPDNADSRAQVLYVGTDYDIVTLDPAKIEDVNTMQVAFNIHAQLVQFTPGTAEIEEGLADDWDVSEDGLVYQFSLRDNALFHKGHGPVTVEDVKYSLGRLIDPDTASPFKPQIEALKEINIVNDRTVELILSEPDPSFLYVLARPEASIIPKEVHQQLGQDFGSEPVGAGPFQFESWSPQSEVVIVRNEDYWGPVPSLDKVVFRIIPEPSTRYAAFESGDVHLLQVTDPDRLHIYEQRDDVKLHRAAAFNTRFIGFNVEREPLDDIRVRRAISHGLNIEQLLDHILPGLSERARGPFSPDIVGFDEGLMTLEYDPEKARELLAEAGYTDGEGPTIDMLIPNLDRFLTPATAFQQDMARIGINIEIESLDTGTYLAMLAEGKASIFSHSRTHNPVPVNVAATWFHSEAVPPGGNYSFMRNDSIDELIETVRSAPTVDDVAEVMPALLQAVIDEAHYIWIDHEYNIYASHEKVAGFKADPFRALMLRDVTLN